jgi:hypothetical protein
VGYRVGHFEDLGCHLLRRAGYDEAFIADVARVMEYAAAYAGYRDDIEYAQAWPTRTPNFTHRNHTLVLAATKHARNLCAAHALVNQGSPRASQQSEPRTLKQRRVSS